MKWAARRRLFRQILSGHDCIFPASVHDPLTARIAAEIGFEAGMFAGSTASLTILGAPDLCLITLTEFADQALRIGRASNLPLIVDADHGYGNALNVARTVEALEIAGVAAITIEDTNLPIQFGARHGSFIPVAEAVGKMSAALAARHDPNLAIIGRTTLDTVNTIDHVITRATAYADAGVDAIFISGIKTISEIETIAAAVKMPLMLGGGKLAVNAQKDLLASHGVRVALQGHHPIKASVRAIYETLSALRNGTAPSALPNLASDEMMARLTEQSEYEKSISTFLG